MKKIYLSILGLLGLGMTGLAQNPGLVISEFLQNPAGTDSPLEYVELVATDDIDFSVTPYTVIFNNNGTATTDGWIEGGSLTYAFEISTGTVSVGDVVYVGGSGMAPTGTMLRTIDTGAEGGDGGIGNANTGGVLGNGGGNGDGIAVFNVAVASITASTEPTDAVFFGTGLGGAVIDAANGYQTPVNDLYDGGKLESGDFYALDADLTIATGTFDMATESFSVARTFASGAGTDGVTDVTILEVVPPVLSFTIDDSTVWEDAAVVTLELGLTGANGSVTSGDIVIMSSSTADSPEDFILLDTTIEFSGLTDEVLTFDIEVEDDAVEEQSEYIIITVDNIENAELDDKTEMFLYITDNDRVLPTATNELKLELLTSFSTGIEGDNSAEIVAFDTTTTNLFVINSEANKVDVIDFSDPELPVLIESIEFDSVGFVNSLDIYGGILAVAVEAPVAQDSGFVSIWNTDGTFLKRLTVGALPDMVTFNHTGDLLVVACEGEPNDDYTVDPNGGVSIIHLTETITDLTAADVTNLDFTDFDALEEDLIEDGVRIFGLDASVSQDLEPEYVTILDDNVTAYVVLQENNAIAVVDLELEEIVEILPLGTIDHSEFGYGLDASNRTSGINIANFEIHGMFMPDAIDNLNIEGENYLFTANEGDARDYDGYSEEVRVDDLILDETAYPDAAYLQNSRLLGRLKTTTATGDTDGDGDIDQIHSYGTRSFSIWHEEEGLIFDSGDLIEQIIANDPVFVDLFNASNDDELEWKNRSDDKGPEPEGVAAKWIDGNAYLFVSLERVGGVMAFNINDPETPEYMGYYNNRDVETDGPDRGAEGMIYIDAEISPNGNGLLILANEVSSTLSIYQVNSCLSLTEIDITTTDDATGFCEGESLEILATESEDLTYQWILEGEDIDEATEFSYEANEAGSYQVSFFNGEEDCEGISDNLIIEIFELPEVSAVATQDTICFGEEVTLTGEGADSYTWDVTGVEDGVAFTPADAGEITYTVTGTDENGCENTAEIDVLMAEEISIDATTIDETLGGDGEINITVDGGIGAYTFDWDNDATGDFDDEEDLTELEAGTYMITVEDEFGCTATETITVNSQVGIEESQLIVGIYPNPTDGHVVIQLGQAPGATVSIVNIAGNVVYQTQVIGSTQNMDLGHLSTGVYFVQVTLGDTSHSQKLIVK